MGKLNTSVSMLSLTDNLFFTNAKCKSYACDFYILHYKVAINPWVIHGSGIPESVADSRG